jgi:hypothetical protein
MLLNYALSTSPAPLQVSTEQSASSGRINLAVFDPNGAWCDKIAVQLPVGPDAQSFGTDPPDTSLSTGRWTIVDVYPPDEFPVMPEIGGTPAKYMFVTTSGKPEQIDYDLVLSLAGALNQTTGQFTYTLAEHSGTSADSLSWSSPLTFALDKVTPQFYLQNLVAMVPTAPAVPVMEFEQGAPVRLEWESNGTWFEVYVKGSPQPVCAGPAPSCDIPGGMTTDTTFFVVAQMTGDPSGDSPSGRFETISLYDSITLTVSNPALMPDTVKASRFVEVGTDLNVGGGVVVYGAAQLFGTLHAGSTQVPSLAVTGTPGDGELRVGDWSFQQDQNGQLVVSNGSETFTLGPNGPYFGSNRMICDNDPVAIWCNGSGFAEGGGWLNGTQNFMNDSTPENWTAWTYWMTSGDWASDLTIRYGRFW